MFSFRCLVLVLVFSLVAFSFVENIVIFYLLRKSSKSEADSREYNFLLGHPQPYSRCCSTSSSVVLCRLYWKGLHFRFPPNDATTCSGINPRP